VFRGSLFVDIDSGDVWWRLRRGFKRAERVMDDSREEAARERGVHRSLYSSPTR
jgi:hypothetical protein